MTTDYDCPSCGAPMKLREGRFGPFYGCTQYPGCTATRREDGSVSSGSRKATTKPTPQPAQPVVDAPDLEVEDTTHLVAPKEDRPAPVNEGGVELPGIEPLDLTIIPSRTINLDSHQSAVVGWRDGQALVAAGAGSGKSTVLVERCASLLLDGVLPEHIVTLVFNSAAGKVLQQRLAERLGQDVATRMVARTFHGWAYGVLRDWEPRNPSYQKGRIIGTDDGPNGWQIASRVAKRLDIKGDISAYISASCQIREALIDVEDEDAIEAVSGMRLCAGSADVAERLVDFTKEFQREKQTAKAIDFADMLYLVGQEIERGSNRAQKLAGMYQHVQCDEAQDINIVRMTIARHLASQAQSFVCVGDLRQSIYGFTGARPDLFKGMLNTGATLLTLPINRRSTGAVVNAGNVVADGHDWNLGGECSPAPTADAGEPVRLWAELGSEMSEGAMVASEIQARIHEGLPLVDATGRANYACLVRTNAQAAGLEAALITRGLPVRVLGTSGGVWTTTMGREVIAYLSAIANEPNDDVTKIANKPVRFLKADDVKTAVEASRNGQDFINVLRIIARQKAPSYRGGPPRHGAWDFAEDLAMMADCNWASRCRSVGEFLQMDLLARAKEDTTGDVLAAAVRPDEDRAALYKALCMAAEDLGSLAAINEQIAQVKKMEGKPAVEISTIHKSKGAEWTCVFVCGVADGALPHAKSDDIEEERRLFYVALTRAKRTCIVSATSEPSPFFKELQGKLQPLPLPPPEGGEPLSIVTCKGAAEPHEFEQGVCVDPINAEEEAAMIEVAGESLVDVEEPTGADRPVVPPTLHERLTSLRSDLNEWLEVAVEVTKQAPSSTDTGPGSRYVEILSKDMDDLLTPLGFVKASKDVSLRASQQVYELGLPSARHPSSYVVVRVYTSIPLAGAAARPLGEDSMKVTALIVNDRDKAFPLHQKLPHTCRTKGWRVSLLERINEVLNIVAEKEG
jgi:DNA helicase II / ATP-dependent DNA helicase PcrA